MTNISPTPVAIILSPIAIGGKTRIVVNGVDMTASSATNSHIRQDTTQDVPHKYQNGG